LVTGRMAICRQEAGLLSNGNIYRLFNGHGFPDRCFYRWRNA
jgi:hypothetical protein